MPDGSKKKILCFGDSNTWGYIPTAGEEDLRYPPKVRWTGRLQAHFPQCVILEEGLNSRTTNLDDPDALGKNGLQALPAILRQHSAVDLLILMLGTNDLKKKFQRPPEAVAEGIASLVRCARERGVGPILVVSPPIPKLKSIYEAYRYPELESKARELAPLYQKVAEQHGTFYLNAAEVLSSSDADGAHLDPEEHEKWASVLEGFIERWLVESKP